MALPSIVTPEFITTVPSTGQQIKYRPFLVKEEKILLMAMEGKDTNEIQNAIMMILNNCILEDIEVDKLATFDVEYLFMQLRAKSVGEQIEVKIGHSHENCSARTDIAINVDDIKVVGEVSDGKIMLTDTVGVKVRYPNLKDLSKVTNDSESLFRLIYNCVEYVYDMEEVYNDFSEKEIEEWLNTLNQAQFKKISDFFNAVPRLSHEVTWKCETCGETDKVTLEGLQSFFI